MSKENKKGKDQKGSKEQTLGITIKKSDDMPEWYAQVCRKAKLADYSPIKGFMVIRPDGYALWEKIQEYFDALIKKRGVQNAYFPLLIPESFFTREAEHAEGFAPELAWVSQKDDDSEERLAIRPTSETIMYDSYSKWIRSWRDLPLRINQWCNVLRWEVSDVKLFLRSREFLWQEGHCVYETEEECIKETKEYLDMYRQVAEDLLCVPVMLGVKTAKEKFAGAKETYTIEGFMPDGKALQMGTSHNLGQGFAKSFGISYKDRDGGESLPWQNSWGISTRMIGALVMVHADDKGLVLPPKIATNKVVIVPILFDKTKEEVLSKSHELKQQLKFFNPIVDDREEYNPGFKFGEWELKGIPVRVELGPRDLENNKAMVCRRDTGEKEAVSLDKLKDYIVALLDTIQEDMFARAKKLRDDNTVQVETWDAFVTAIESRKLVETHLCDDPAVEEAIKAETSATSRLIPFGSKPDPGAKCVKTGKDAAYKIFFAKNY